MPLTGPSRTPRPPRWSLPCSELKALCRLGDKKWGGGLLEAPARGWIVLGSWSLTYLFKVSGRNKFRGRKIRPVSVGQASPEPWTPFISLYLSHKLGLNPCSLFSTGGLGPGPFCDLVDPGTLLGGRGCLPCGLLILFAEWGNPDCGAREAAGSFCCLVTFSPEFGFILFLAGILVSLLLEYRTGVWKKIHMRFGYRPGLHRHLD